MDYQSGLLVTLKSDGQRTVWLWLDASSDTVNWNSLRRAVFSCVHNSSADDIQSNQRPGEIA
jgi:hypothetical protein